MIKPSLWSRTSSTVTTLACLVLPAAASAQFAGPWADASIDARYDTAIEDAGTFIDSLMAAEGIPGVSVAVGVDGEIVWSEGFGYADVENRVPVTTLTKFRIGSVSKTLTSSALARLVEEGRIDLDAPIQRYVPNFPVKRYPITTRQLAGHLAGIRHYRGNGSITEGQRAYDNVNDALAIFSHDSLLFQPGSQYSYSSYGWNLISAIIQSAAGEPFLQYMDEVVFQPLGLRHTVADHVDSIIPYRTSFYSRDRNNRLVNAPWVNDSYKWAGGGFLANMEDLVRYGFAFTGSDYLRRETISMLWTSQRTTDGEETGYGMGWRTGHDHGGRWWVGHSGGSVGGRTQFVLYPDQDVVVAVTANLSSAPMSVAVVERIAAGFFVN